MATVKINLVVSLVPVGTRQADIKNQVFALHLSAAFAEEGYSADFEKLLHPWESKWNVQKIITAIRTVTAGGTPEGKKFESDRLAEKKNPPADAQALGVLQNKLISKITGNVWSPDLITKNPQAPEKNKPDQQSNLIEAVHTLSLYPGSIPNDSGVLHYFVIAPLGWTPTNADLIAAVPKLAMTVADGKKLVFTPRDFDLAHPENFDFDVWQDGWIYKAEMDGAETGDFTLTAYVKPLKIADADGIFYDETEKPAADFGLNFKDYWFRSQKSPLWQNRLEDFADAVTDFGKRMAEAASIYVNLPDAESSADLWEDLRLMSLGLYAQWDETGKDLPGVDLPTYDETEIVGKIKAKLALAPGEETALKTVLSDFRAELRGGIQQPEISDRDKKRRFWLNIFRRAFGDEIKNIISRSNGKPSDEEIRQTVAAQDKEYCEALLKRAIETPGDFRAVLFYIWDFAIQGLTAADTLQKKWNDFFHNRNTLPDSAKKFIDQVFDFSVLREKLRKKVLSDLSGKEKSDDVKTFIKERLTLLRNYFENAEFLPPIVTAPDALWDKWKTEFVEKYTNGLLGENVLLTDETGQIVENEPKFETKPGGLTIQFDKLAARQNIAPKDDEINWRKIAGVGLIVREMADGKKWHLATAATIDLNKEIVIPAHPLIKDTALIPVRVPYKNGIRYPFLTYNQRSLISPTALAAAVKNSFAATDTRNGAGTTKWTPLYEYGAPETTNDFFKLVPLRFGKKYQMAAFMVDTAGGLPDKLRNGQPYIFEPNENIFNPDGTPALPPKVVQNFNYWRKVPVGQVRISALELTGARQPKDWQEVPEKVFPLMWEINSDEQSQTPHPSEQKLQRKQLILLYEGAERFAFGVRPPIVDIDVLERWLPLSTDPDKKHLQGVLTGYFTRLNKRQPNAPFSAGDTANDLTIDDPAVENLLFVLENYSFDEEKWRVAGAYSHPLSPVTGNEISDYQRPWQKVICLRSDESIVRKANQANSTENGSDITVTIKHDTVNLVRLRVLALVSNKFIENTMHPQASPKFSEGFFGAKSPAAGEELSAHVPDEFLFLEDLSNYTYENDPAKKAVEDATRDFIALKSQQILLETPNTQMPDPGKLWLSLKLELIGNNDRVNVLLEQDEAEKAARRNIIRCELRQQQWRWQGRPIEREGKTDIASLKNDWAKEGVVKDDKLSDEEFLKWETTAFAELREAFDLITIPLPYSLNAPDLLYCDNLEKDLRALFIRYGLRVFSRYEALFSVEPVTTRQFFKATDGNNYPLSGTGWKRVLVRYRGAKPAKPLVQAIVPLTQPFAQDDNIGKAVSLMLVLDQTAHAQCGITEKIECELMKVDLPDEQLAEKPKEGEKPPPKQLYQAGHDPILRVDPRGFPNPASEKESLSFKLGGAFGHTFDTGARQPLFGSSSYIIQADLEKTNKYKLEDWDFAKIRLRRLSGEDRAAEEADWADAIWVQFPPSSAFVASQKLEIISLPGKTFQVNFAPDSSTFAMFKYCLILTQEISDFRGQRGSESYLGLVNLKNDPALKDNLQGVFGKDLPEKQTIKARLVEVQVAPTRNAGETKDVFPDLPADENSFWEKLLKTGQENEDSSNTEYRVTRISPVFKVGKGK